MIDRTKSEALVAACVLLVARRLRERGVCEEDVVVQAKGLRYTLGLMPIDELARRYMAEFPPMEITGPH